MTSTKEEPGPFDGLERAKPGEPVFTLRAHDPLSDAFVEEWVRRRRRAILALDLPHDKERLELIQCKEAEEIAQAMRDWRSGVQQEAPAPVVAKEKYSGHETSADELAAMKRFDAFRDSARRLDNSVTEINEAAETLSQYEDERRLSPMLITYAESLKAIAAQVRPKRASYAHRAEIVS